MAMSNPLAVMSGLFIGLLGVVLLVFGKNQQRLLPVLAGVVLSVLPMVVTSMVVLWVLTAACLGGVYWVERQG